MKTVSIFALLSLAAGPPALAAQVGAVGLPGEGDRCTVRTGGGSCAAGDSSGVAPIERPGSTLASHEIDRFGPATSLLDLVHGSLPGAYSLDVGSRNDLNRTIRIRGPVGFPVCSTCAPRILMDGVETNAIAPASISPYNLSGVAVFAGPRTFLFGTDAAAGVLSLAVRKEGENPGMRVEGRASMGSLTTSHPEGSGLSQSYAANASGRFEGGGFSVGILRGTVAGHVPEYGGTATAASAGFVSRMSSLQVSGFSRYSERRFEMPGWGSAYYGLYADGLLPDWGRIDDNDYGRHRQLTVGLGLSYHPSPRARFDATLGDDIVDLETFGLPTFAPGDSMVGSQSDRYTLPSLRVISELDVLDGTSVRATVAVGADWRHARRVGFGSYRRHTEQARTPSWRGEIFEDDYTNGGVLAETRVAVMNALFVDIGLRADHHTLFADGEEWSVNPGGSIAYEIAPTSRWSLRPRAGWGRGVTAPSLAMRAGEAPGISPNAALAPQTTAGWEAGADLVALGRRLEIGATWYAQTTDDVFDLLLGAPGEPAIYANAGTIRTSGQELSLGWRGGALEVSGSISTFDVEQTRDSARLEMVDREDAVPDRVASLTAVYSAARSMGWPVEVGGRVFHLGSRSAYDPRTYFAAQRAGESVRQTIGSFDPLTRVDLFLKGALVRHLRGRLDVRNVFDAAIQEVPEMILPGRELRVTLEASF